MTTTWKPNVQAGELATGIFFKAFMGTGALLDLSAALYAVGTEKVANDRLLFLWNYMEWQAAAPVVSQMRTALLCLLPFVIFGLVKNSVQTILGWAKGTPKRNGADLIQAFALLGGVLPTAITKLVPLKKVVSETCGWGVIGPKVVTDTALGACHGSATALVSVTMVMAGLNLLMIVCDIFRYQGNCEEGRFALEAAGKKTISKEESKKTK